jgi:hypothetical protein
MNTNSGVRFLRPYLFKDLPVRNKSRYLKFFNTTRCFSAAAARADKLHSQSTHHKLVQIDLGVANPSVDGRALVEQRINDLKGTRALKYPRIESDGVTLTVADFRNRYGNCDQKGLHNESVRLYGLCYGVACL